MTTLFVLATLQWTWFTWTEAEQAVLTGVAVTNPTRAQYEGK
jgi:hypothetical protein